MVDHVFLNGQRVEGVIEADDITGRVERYKMKYPTNGTDLHKTVVQFGKVTFVWKDEGAGDETDHELRLHDGGSPAQS
jgi:hypothetical protein